VDLADAVRGPCVLPVGTDFEILKRVARPALAPRPGQTGFHLWSRLHSKMYRWKWLPSGSKYFPPAVSPRSSHIWAEQLKVGARHSALPVRWSVCRAASPRAPQHVVQDRHPMRLVSYRLPVFTGCGRVEAWDGGMQNASHAR